MIPEKYYRYFQKIFHLTGSENSNNVNNYMIKTSDNIFLDTIHIINPDKSKCIIFFHGNAGNLTIRFDMIKFLYNYASIIIFDYRSYGRSTGDATSLSSHSLHKDAQAIWNFATNKLGIHPNDISLFGESLGCAIAIELASKLSENMDSKFYPHSLILNAPFYSLSSMITSTFNKLNLGFLSKIVSAFVGREYCSDQWIKLINHRTKIIIAHSPRDEIVPFDQGLKLYKLIANIHANTKFITLSGTHNNLGLPENYIYALADLFDD